MIRLEFDDARQILEKYVESLRRGIKRNLPVEVQASFNDEDIFQKSWADLARLLPGKDFESYDKLKRWFEAIVRINWAAAMRQASMQTRDWRRVEVKGLSFFEGQYSNDRTPSSNVARTQRSQAVRDAVGQLPAKFRDSLEMQLDGHSVEQIARLTRTTKSTIYNNIKRGKLHLRKKLEGQQL